MEYDITKNDDGSVLQKACKEVVDRKCAEGTNMTVTGLLLGRGPTHEGRSYRHRLIVTD